MHIEEIEYRREGKGRRCCLGDRIDSIPCQTSYFVPLWYEEMDELYLFFKSSYCKIASVARNWINSIPYVAVYMHAGRYFIMTLPPRVQLLGRWASSACLTGPVSGTSDPPSPTHSSYSPPTVLTRHLPSWPPPTAFSHLPAIPLSWPPAMLSLSCPLGTAKSC